MWNKYKSDLENSESHCIVSIRFVAVSIVMLFNRLQVIIFQNQHAIVTVTYTIHLPGVLIERTLPLGASQTELYFRNILSSLWPNNNNIRP